MAEKSFSSQDYYQPDQIRELIEQANVKRQKEGLAPLTLSTFYRRVEKGAIGVFPPHRQKRQKAKGYRRSDVDAFLNGKLPVATRTRSIKNHPKARLVAQRRDLPSIDVVSIDDIPAVSWMEMEQLGSNAFLGAVILSWLKKNDHLFWMEYDPKNRRGMNGQFALLGVLPLRGDLIQSVLQGKLLPRQITPEDILTYEVGHSYTCLIISTVTLPDHQASLRLLFQHILAYWCENGIEVSHLYVVGEETRKETAIMRLVAESFFAPSYQFDSLNGSLVWELRFNRFNPAFFVHEYQKCIERSKNIERLEKKRMNTITAIETGQAKEELKSPVEEQFGKAIHQRRRNFDRLDRYLFKVDAGGRLDIEHEDVRFRPIQSDEDIIACLRINASWFGESKKTERELVEQRRAWLNIEPSIFRVLEVEGEVVAFISAYPLPELTIERILRGEIRISDIPLEDLLTYKPGIPVSVYFQTIAVHKKFSLQERRHFGIYMSSGFRDMINRFGTQGIEIEKIYTRSDEADGINMAYNLGFQKMVPIPGVEKLILVLDFSREDLPFLFEYQRRLEEYKTKQSAQAIRSASN